MISYMEPSFLASPYLLFPPQNPAINCVQIQAAKEILRFIAKMGGPIVCFLNKYTMRSVNSEDSIHNQKRHGSA